MRLAVKGTAVGVIALSLVFAEVGLGTAEHTNEDFFDFIITANVGDDDAPNLQDPRAVGTFRYQRHLSTPTLDAPAGWLDGDRNAYSCAYAFLTYRGHIVGRTTYSYIDPPGSGNAPVINDKFMHEGIRHWADGSLDGNPELEQMDPGTSCPGPAGPSDQFPSPGSLPNNLPVVTFQHGPHTIEVRDFADPADSDNVGPGHEFSIVSESDRRIDIIAFQDGTPVLAIRYDLITTAVVPGTDHPVTMFSRGGGAFHLSDLKTRTQGGRATITGRIHPPAPAERVSLTFFANGPALRKVAKNSATLNAESRFRKSLRVPAESTRCRIRVAVQGDAVGKKMFRC
jgi:hypothetical protein